MRTEQIIDRLLESVNPETVKLEDAERLFGFADALSKRIATVDGARVSLKCNPSRVLQLEHWLNSHAGDLAEFGVARVEVDVPSSHLKQAIV